MTTNEFDEDAKKKTRYEQNEELFNAFAEVFIEPVATQFKCVFRPKARGAGIVVDTEKIKELEHKLHETNRTLDNRATQQALDQLGIAQYESFYTYEKLNPKQLDKEQLHEEWTRYIELENKIKKDLKNQLPRAFREEALCVQIGEEIKSLERGSFPVNVLMGVQARFLTKEEKAESAVIADAFYDLTKRGNIFLRPERPEQVSETARSILSTETIIKMGQEKNEILRRIINPKLIKTKCIKEKAGEE